MFVVIEMKQNKKAMYLSAHKISANTSEIVISKRNIIKDCSLHWHKFFEVEIILEGKGIQILNGEEYPLKKGCAYVLLPTDFHEIKVEESLVLYNVAFHENVLSEEFLLAISSKLHGNTIFYCNDTDLHELHKICTLIESEFIREKSFKKEFLKNILECFLIAILRNSEFDSKLMIENKNDYIKDAILYMQLHFKDNPTLTETAEAVNLYPSYFSHIFKEQTGTGYIEYLTDLKISYSKKLLRSTNLNVTEVCFASGFASLPNFMKIFKKK